MAAKKQAKPETKAYLISNGKHVTKEKTYVKGDEIQLNKAQAKALANKVIPKEGPKVEKAKTEGGEGDK